MKTITASVETRLPKAELWLKTVTAVKEKAKTGHDWSGEFLAKEGKLADMVPGDIVIDCDNRGSRKHPVKLVGLNILLPNGEWERVCAAKSNEWAYELRKEAREWLDMSREERVVKAATIRAARLKTASETSYATEEDKKKSTDSAANVEKWTALYITDDTLAEPSIIAEIIALRPTWNREKLAGEIDAVLAHVLSTLKEAARHEAAYA